ncbi:MAG: hypothetical protein M9915_03315 [Rhizobacter sp.]|nr:hypothetical protein [Rhizobacter sp.]
MNVHEQLTQRIEHLKSLQALLNGARGAFASPTVTLTSDQLATLDTLVFSELYANERSVRKLVALTEVLRRLEPGESISNVDLPD